MSDPPESTRTFVIEKGVPDGQIARRLWTVTAGFEVTFLIGSKHFSIESDVTTHIRCPQETQSHWASS